MAEAGAPGGAGEGAGASGSPGAGGTGSGTGTPSSGDWTTGLSDSLKSYVQTKGFKAPSDVLESYQNFEKIHGAPLEHIIKLPPKMEGDAAKAIWQKLGLPKEAKDYTINIPKELGDEKLSEWIKNAAYKNNMTAGQIEGFVKDWVEQTTSQQKEAQEQRDFQVKQAEENLKKEWGNAYDQNKNLANQGAKRFGMNEEQVQALGQVLGADKAMQLLHKLAVGTGEASFHSGQGAGSGVKTPAAARAEIDQLKRDEGFLKRFNAKDKEALDKWQRLHVEAYPENAQH